MHITAQSTLAEIWLEFETRLLDPVDAPPEQRAEMKKAFYGGALAMQHLMGKMGDIPEDEAIELMHQREDEGRSFVSSLILAEASVKFDWKQFYPKGP